MTTPTGGRDKLSSSLVALRDAAGLSGAKAARAVGASPAKLNRIEHGLILPTPELVEALCRLYKAPATERRRLMAMARDVKAGSRRVVLRSAVGPLQEKFNRLREQSALVRGFTTIGVIGLLQTVDYARAVMHTSDLTPEAAEEGVAARLAGQAILDEDSSRRFVFVMTEGALGWAVAPPKVMAEQMDHLAAASLRDNTRVGIIPWGTVAPVLPLHGWEMYDERLVIAGFTHVTAAITDKQDVRRYLEVFAELERLAVFGDQARDVLVQIAADYRAMA